ncbi:hypothetical protein ES332_A02G152300v1 [Gossypium tomentosum]|uniref:DUF4371 domain-containing protein n=1 Tax=Gossypium tomentosum TaxID=34277 RepID=A0A5D2RHN7_GOSTO|nr:hypothetical protein ES332_A02G152300v1 [Gossypium tomentosum]
MLKLLASYNKDVDATLQVFARKVQSLIHKQIGYVKFCLIVDESKEISKKEHMAIVVRYVDKQGSIRECFLDLVHVKDTTSLTLKIEICVVLSHHTLSLHNLKGQGYDGASKMCEEWNGLQGSSKHHDELQANQIAELEHLIEIEELEIGKCVNQIGTLQQLGDTRWSYYYKSICSLLKMYGATREVLTDIVASNVKEFCEQYGIVISDKLAPYYLNNRFNEQATQLLILSAALNPRDDSGWGCYTFNVQHICNLVEKFYPEDFSKQEKDHLKYELQHYGDLSTLGDLCQGLVTARKTEMYHLVDRLLRLVLTLFTSTATTEKKN